MQINKKAVWYNKHHKQSFEHLRKEGENRFSNIATTTSRGFKEGTSLLHQLI